MTPLGWLFVLAGLVSLDVRMMPAIAASTIPTTFVYIGDTVHYAHRQKVVARFASVFSRRRRCRPPSRAR